MKEQNTTKPLFKKIAIISGVLVGIPLYHFGVILAQSFDSFELFYLERLGLTLDFSGGIIVVIPYLYLNKLNREFKNISKINQWFIRIGIIFVLVGFLILIIVNYIEHGL